MLDSTGFDQRALARLKTTAAAQEFHPLVSLLRRFVRQREAGTTVEFGLLAAPFVAALFATLQTALVFFAGQSLETAAAASARLIFTGQAQTSGWSAAQFKDQVCSQIHGIFNATTASMSTSKPIRRFRPPTSPCRFPTASSMPDRSAIIPAARGDIVVLRLYYQYPVFVNLLGFNLSNLNNGTDLLAATAVFRNEPYVSS